MAQRNSEYARKERDLYETPEWVTDVIMDYIPASALIWEPACASGRMAQRLHATFASDLVTTYGKEGVDFLKAELPPGCDTIITNPPFGRNAEAFIRHALKLLRNSEYGYHFFIAMLLPINFDAASTRADLFGACPEFRTKVILTKRIVWFEREDGEKAAPSENHAWFIWTNWTGGPPNIEYYYAS